jgi:predicted transcriptional regulator
VDDPMTHQADPLSAERLAFIEEVGLLLEQRGLPRMAGRLLGALLLADPPEQSADALAATLRASRGSISSATKLLEHIGFIDRVSKPGERRTYYRNKPGAWLEMTRRGLAQLSAYQQLAERGLTLLDSDDPEVRRGLAEMRDFYDFVAREFPAVFARWEEREGS